MIASLGINIRNLKRAVMAGTAIPRP